MTRQQAAGLSIAFNAFQTLVKLAAALMTGSVGLLSEVLHCASDVASSGVAFFSVKVSTRPPDEEHPYGHGKVESLTGFGESLLLVATAIWVASEAIPKLRHPAELTGLEYAIPVLVGTAVCGLLVATRVAATAKREQSLALKANAQHLMADVLTTSGVLAALIATKMTGWKLADPVFALGLSVWLALNGFLMIRTTADQLIDRRLSDEESGKVTAILKAEARILSYHRLRSRLSGHMRYVDLHIVVPAEWTVVEAHTVADELEDAIEGAVAPAHCTIHVDPFDPDRVDPP